MNQPTGNGTVPFLRASVVVPAHAYLHRSAAVTLVFSRPVDVSMTVARPAAAALPVSDPVALEGGRTAQFSEGLSTRSITRTSTCSVDGFNVRPASCSRAADTGRLSAGNPGGIGRFGSNVNT